MTDNKEKKKPCKITPCRKYNTTRYIIGTQTFIFRPLWNFKYYKIKTKRILVFSVYRFIVYKHIVFKKKKSKKFIVICCTYCVAYNKFVEFFFFYAFNNVYGTKYKYYNKCNQCLIVDLCLRLPPTSNPKPIMTIY